MNKTLNFYKIFDYRFDGYVQPYHYALECVVLLTDVQFQVFGKLYQKYATCHLLVAE